MLFDVAFSGGVAFDPIRRIPHGGIFLLTFSSADSAGSTKKVTVESAGDGSSCYTDERGIVALAWLFYG